MATKLKVKLTPVAEAWLRCKPATEALTRSDCREMEVTEDKCGIVWARWITPVGRSLILVSTPHWYDVYEPVSDSNLTAETVSQIERAAILPRENA